MFSRILAFLIDTILMGAIVVGLLFVTMGKTPASLKASGDEAPPSLMDKYQFFAYFEPIAMDPNRDIYIKRFIQNYPAQGGVAFILIPWLWFALMESMFGGSIGKLATGIRVRRKDYGKAGLGVTTVRLIGKAISTLIVGLGYLLAFFDKKNQALHDKIANTLVVKK
ncbi:MAG: RDD family protein [Chitinophagales bacterium]|nr:RDD family protein [Chitinophagales bacterium]MCB9019321.1 RDD family protein [Chitinophagales bacterium]HPE97056.1 RDD family protein [Chitinophagales bacterium]HQU38927.1 RDD family protein [Chitinophagales bacterium]HQU76970.1 RDD family protein [Chitinophagales bacterium]